MARVPKSVARDRERRAVALHVAGLKFDDIAEQVGYASRSAAYEAVMRAISREVTADVEAIRTTELTRLEELWIAFYPKARRGDPVAFDKCVKILERRAKYLGLDFSDGIEERKITLAEAQGEMISKLITAVLEDPELGLSEEKRNVARALFGRHMRALPA